jgi:ribonuclease HI
VDEIRKALQQTLQDRAHRNPGVWRKLESGMGGLSPPRFLKKLGTSAGPWAATLHHLAYQLQGYVRVVAPAGEQAGERGEPMMELFGPEPGDPGEQETGWEVAMELAWTNGDGEGRLDNWSLVVPIGSAESTLRTALGDATFAHADAHARMWEELHRRPGAGEGDDDMMTAVSRVQGLETSGLSTSEIRRRVAAVMVEGHRDHLRRQAHELVVDGTVTYEAVMGLSTVLGRGVVVCIPGVERVSLEGWGVPEGAPRVALAGWHHSHHGRPDRWTILTSTKPEPTLLAAETSAAGAQAAGEEEGEEIDQRKRRHGALEWWTWDSRRQPIPEGHLEALLHQHPPYAEVCETDGWRMTLEHVEAVTSEERRAGGHRFREWDNGLGALDGRYWLPPSVVWRILRHWAGARGHGFEHRTRDMSKVWIAEMGTLESISGERTVTPPQAARILLFPHQDENGVWGLGVVDVGSRTVAFVDSGGQEHVQKEDQLEAWGDHHSGEAGGEVWTRLRVTTKRRTEELDSGIFVIADAMCIAEGRDPVLLQAGAGRMRRWLAYMLWMEGNLGVVVHGQSLTPAGIRLRQGELPRNVTRLDTWHAAGEGEGEIRMVAPAAQPTIYGFRPTAPLKGGKGATTRKRAREDGKRRLEEFPQWELKAKRVQGASNKPPRPGAAEEECESVRTFTRRVMGEQGGEGGKQQKWTVGDGRADEWSYILSHNIGPVGWKNSKPDVSQMLGSLPAIVNLQDVRLPRRLVKGVRASMEKIAPQYHMVVSTSQCRRRLRPEEGGGARRRKYWTGVMTLVHKDLQPDLEPVDLERCGLGDAMVRLCRGRVLITRAPAGDGRGESGKYLYNVNVYQFTADKGDHQRELLQAVSAVLRGLQTSAEEIVVCGDFNAALGGQREGYSTDMRWPDEQLTRWLQQEELRVPEVGYKFTWQSPSGPQRARLDYTMWWSPQEGVVEGGQARSQHPGHDHGSLWLRLPSNRVRRPATGKTDSRRKILNFKDPGWQGEKRDQWQEGVEEAVRQSAHSGGDILRRQQAVWKASWDLLYSLIGKEVSAGMQGVPLQNKTTRGLMKQVRHLRVAVRELEGGTEGTAAQARAAVACDTTQEEARDGHQMMASINARWKLVQDRAEQAPGQEGDGNQGQDGERQGWRMAQVEGRISAAQATMAQMKRHYNKLVDAMHNENMTKVLKAKRDKFDSGGEREVQRFLDKLAPVPALGGILPRADKRHYPWVLEVRGEGREAFLEWMGAEFRQVVGRRQKREGEFHVSSNGKEVQVWEEGEVTRYGISPVTDITEFLSAHQHLGEGTVRVSTTPAPRMFTKAGDKLAQMELYFAEEGQAVGAMCGHRGCARKQCVPLAYAPTGSREREVRWWCQECQLFTNMVLPEVAPPRWLEEIAVARPMHRGTTPAVTRTPSVVTWFQRPQPSILRHNVTEEDWEFLLAHLPRRKAAGADGICYEMMREAPGALRDLLLESVNAMLHGHILPREWQGGMVRLLTKREPASMLENLRPITLLQTTYKLFTAVVADRLSYAMEHGGMLESAQHGSRPRRQTQAPIAKLQYVVSEAKRLGKTIYVAYLDWFNAFCSLSLEKMYQALVAMGMSEPDMGIIRQAHAGAWVQVSTPFGSTATIQVTRGTPQGDCLSPLLFVFFINICLRKISATGKGFVHSCGVRRNAACFVDDIALLAGNAEDMNTMLAAIHEFSLWSGMDLCVCKCEVTAYDFARGEEVWPDRVHINGRPLTRLSPHEAFRYLGMRMSLTGDTRAEKQHVRERMRAVKDKLSSHPYRTDQANKLVDMCVHPVLTYSGPMTQWTYEELRAMEVQWAIMRKKAWNLTDGHNTAPFLLPAEEGGVQGTTPARLLARHTANVMAKLSQDLDGEILQLVREEWSQLVKTWGTARVDQVQLLLMLEDSTTRPATLLARTLYYTGLVGISPVWDKVPGMFPPPPGRDWDPSVGVRPPLDQEEEGAGEGGEEARPPLRGRETQREQPGNPRLMTMLTDYAHGCVRQGWVGKDMRRYNKMLAEALRKLAAAAKGRMADLRQGNEWVVPPGLLEGEESDALLTALETSVEGTRRQAVAHRTTWEARGGPSPRRDWGDDPEWEEDREVAALKTQIQDPKGTSWVPSHRLRPGGTVEGAYAPPSPTARRLRVPRARKHQGTAAAPLRQTLLEGFLKERERGQGESWLETANPVPELVPPVDCATRAEMGETRHHCTWGEVVISKGRAEGRREGATVWQGEAAKIAQWQCRTGWTWQQMSEAAEAAARAAEKAEAPRSEGGQDFRMLAWQLLDELRAEQGFDTIVGPTELEAPPKYERWVGASQAFQVEAGWSPVVLLNAIPAEMQRLVLSAVGKCDRWAVIGHVQKNSAILRDLEDMGTCQSMDSVGAKVYAKGWYVTGDKTLYQGTSLSIWTPARMGSCVMTPPRGTLPFAYRREFPRVNQDAHVYQDALQSGGYWKAEGQVVWTDGSRKLLGPEEGLRVGAGAYSRDPALCFAERIGGEAVPLRGELGAVALTLRRASRTIPLTILTDCMSCVLLVRRWARRDFRKAAEEEAHWDILGDILEHLRQRTAATTMVWVKGHCGDPGNTVADQNADEGCHREEEHFRRALEPMAFYSSVTGAQLSPSGWTSKVETAARVYQGSISGERLRNTNSALSTQSLQLSNSGKEIMGAVLAEKGRRTLPAAMRRDFLQMIGNAFPVYEVVARNSGGAVSSRCPLCHGEEESYAHMQMWCGKTKEARMAAHDRIMAALLQGIRRQHPSAVIHDRARVDAIGECEDGRIGAYVPDAVVEATLHGKTTVMLLEFSRGLAEGVPDHDFKVATKTQDYSSTIRHFRRQRGPGVDVLQQTYIMSCHGKVDMARWSQQLAWWGIQGKALRVTMEGCMTACVEGNHEIANVRRRLMVEE